MITSNNYIILLIVMDILLIKNSDVKRYAEANGITEAEEEKISTRY